jgi:hypothetical protein
VTMLLFLFFALALMNLAGFAVNLASASYAIAVLNFVAAAACVATIRRMSHGHRTASQKASSYPAQAPGFTNARVSAAISSLALAIAREENRASLPIEDAGIRAGEIVGHRMWLVIEEHLHSIYRCDYRWFPGQPASGDPEERPFGVYACKELDPKDFTYPRTSGLGSRIKGVVIGTVDLWGIVIEHERGYRAQFAAVRSLDGGWGNIDLEALRSRYCPPDG